MQPCRTDKHTHTHTREHTQQVQGDGNGGQEPGDRKAKIYDEGKRLEKRLDVLDVIGRNV